MPEIRVEQREEVAVVMLARPPVNAMTAEFCADIADAIEAAARDSGTAALVLAGEGRCFSAGVDLKTVIGYDRAAQDRMLHALNRLFGAAYACPLPLIAAVHGHAIAGGLILALACDHRIGPSAGGQFGLTEIRVAVPYPVAAIEIVRAELAEAARRLVLFGRTIGPQEALALKIFDELQPPETVLARALDLAHEAATLPRQAFARIKGQLRQDALERIAQALAEGDPLAGAWLSEEAQTAAAAMLARR